MDIHKPKPVHNLREFLSEITVIVIGIAIALTGEQTIEAWHWQHEVADTRNVLDQEIARNLSVVQHRVDIAPCIGRRLSELRSLIVAHGRGEVLSPRVPVSQPNFPRLNSAALKAAEASGALGRMPVELRLKYARIYDGFDWVSDKTGAENSQWSSLVAIDDYGSLSDADWAALRVARAQAQGLSDKLNANLLPFTDEQGHHRPFIDNALQLGIRPSPLGLTPASIMQQRAFCQKLF